MKRLPLLLLLIAGTPFVVAFAGIGMACLAALWMWQDIRDTARTGRVPWSR